jgi:hypothetical protein
LIARCRHIGVDSGQVELVDTGLEAPDLVIDTSAGFVEPVFAVFN